DDPVRLGFMAYRDPAYLRDGLGLLMACEAMLMGRVIYEANARIWPARAHPWADRLNSMKKYVFSSSLGSADWNNSTIIRDDAAATVAKLKEQGGDGLLGRSTYPVEPRRDQELFEYREAQLRRSILAGSR